LISEFLPEGWKVGAVHEVRLPTYINVSKKSSKALNLNIYRNLHHHHLNKQKQNFHDDVKPLLKDIPKAEKIWIHYTIFAPRYGRLDTMNVGSIVDKYFSDTMVEAEKIMDDHFDHVVLVSFSFGGVRPMDGHAIAKIHILEQETSEMRILLDKEDIQSALETYIDTMGFVGASGIELSVNDDGEIEAEVLMGTAEPKPKPQTKNKGGRPRGSKNKTSPKKEETVDDTNADNDTEDGSDGTDTGSDKPAKEPAKSGAEEAGSGEGKTKKGNLFGEEDDQSSDSTETTTESDTPDTAEDLPAEKPKVKKSSIFDVD
jgi:hypothetical protein